MESDALRMRPPPTATGLVVRQSVPAPDAAWRTPLDMNGYMAGLDSDLTVRDNLIRNDPPARHTAAAAPTHAGAQQVATRHAAAATTGGRVDYHSVVEDPHSIEYTPEGHQIVTVINNAANSRGATTRFVIREHADVVVPPFPEPIFLAGWLGTLIHNVIAASGRNDQMFVFKWLEEAWTTKDMSEISITPDSLRSIEMNS